MKGGAARISGIMRTTVKSKERSGERDLNGGEGGHAGRTGDRMRLAPMRDEKG
jgi:hypothetical protein